MRKQKAVYWAAIGFDAFGKPEYSAPVEIDVRWEDVAEEYMDENGVKQLSRSIVYVDRDTPIGGALFLGGLTDLDDDSVPFKNSGAYEIRAFEKLPNLRNTEILRTVRL